MASLPPVPPRILTGSKPPSKAGGSPRKPSPNSPPVFAAVVLLTLICLGVSLYLTKQASSTAVLSLNEKVTSVFYMGCGSIFTLLGRKAIGSR